MTGKYYAKMRNSVQNYAWGSKHALTELYGIENPDNLPMAELWMGAHPKSSSLLLDEQGQAHNLRDVINSDQPGFLGNAVAQRFGELPFLFKVLCAEQPLSIQVHPNKSAAEVGFARGKCRRYRAGLSSTQLQGRQPQTGTGLRTHALSGDERLSRAG